MSSCKKGVRVYLRVRPPVSSELARRDALNAATILEENPQICVLKNPKKKPDESDTKEYRFQRCFDQNSTQDEVYEQVARDAVEDVFQGYHGLVFVYGQTGTGKTYTLCCQDEGNEGILYNSIVDVFSRIEQDTEHQYECSLQFVQIYNEVVQDLLSSNPKQSVVQLRDDPELDGAVYLPGCTTVAVNSANECLKYYLIGGKHRTFASTDMNRISSRSHTIFTLDVQIRKRIMKSDVDCSNVESTGDIKLGRLTLVDLAGSEKIKKTHSEGTRLVEATNINSSLLVLGKVVNALLDEKQTHVPYRESKLTRLLQYPMSGLGKTSIVVTVGPSALNYEETLAAILFGQRAMRLKVNAKVHEKVDWKALALKLQAMVEQGMDNVRTQAMEEQALDYEKQIQEFKERSESLEKQLKETYPADLKGLAEENHGLRELGKILNEKLIRIAESRKQDKLKRKQMQHKFQTAEVKRVELEVQLKEMELMKKEVENLLIATQNQVLEVSQEVRRLHKECLKAGLPGRNPSILLTTTAASVSLAASNALTYQQQSQKLPQQTDSISSLRRNSYSPQRTSSLVNLDSTSSSSSVFQKSKSSSLPMRDCDLIDDEFTEEDAEDEEEEEEDGTLEVASKQDNVHDFRSPNQDDISAYTDTSEQLVCALKALQCQKEELERLRNESKIADTSKRKAIAKLQDNEAETLRLRDRCSELEEQLRELKAQVVCGVKESHKQEKERFNVLVHKMSEYEIRMDKYKTQMQRATNEARLEANAKGKLKSKLEQVTEEAESERMEKLRLKRQIEELQDRMVSHRNHSILDTSSSSTTATTMLMADGANTPTFSSEKSANNSFSSSVSLQFSKDAYN